MADFIEVQTTTARQDEAQQIAQALVEQRVAACVQISGPITSVYRWQGAIEKDQEWRCTAKTTRALFPAVEKAIRELHQYDTPQIIALPIELGSEDYLRWVDEMTAPKGQ